MSERGEERAGRAAWLFLAAAAAVSLLFYRDFAFHPERLLLGTDMLGEGFPLRRFAVDEVRAGRGIPGWTPYVYGGMPYVALLPGPLFYPTSLLYLVLPLFRAIGWTFVLHTFLAGALGYFLGRSFRLRAGSSVVCGASFMLTGYVTSHLYGGHDGRIFAMVLIPLALGCLERALRGEGTRWWVALAGAVALQALTPHTQLMYFSSLALALYLAFHLVARVEGGGRAYARPALGFAGAFALAGGLAAAQLLPTLALLEHVVRAAPESGYEFAASWALPPQELSALVLPDLVGSLDTYWGRNPFKLHTEYVGTVPLALATLAVAGAVARGGAGAPREERRTVLFLAGASLLGLLFALGSATPVHRIAYALVPMMKSFRAPAMMMGPVACFVALLAAFGWERALRARGRRAEEGPAEGGVDGGGGGLRLPWPTALLSAPFLLLGTAAVLSPRGLLDFAYHGWFPAGWPRTPPPELEGALRAGGMILVGGWTVAIGTAEAVARRRVGRVAVVAVALLALLDLWRVDARYLRTASADEALAPDAVIEALQERLAPGQRAWAAAAYRPNDLMYYGIPTPDGSQKFLLRWFSRLVGGIRPAEALAGRPRPLWPLFDVRYVVAREGVETPLLEPLATTGLYAVTDTAPHAYFPERVELVPDPAEALRRTLGAPDPTAVAVVAPLPGADAGGGEREAPAAGAGSAEVVRYEPDEILLRVRAERPGLLVVSEVWHPAWEASIDGRAAPVWRANVAFRAVELPAGEHELRFRYRSAAFRVGIVVSLLSLLIAVAALAAPRLRRRGRAVLPGSGGSP